MLTCLGVGVEHCVPTQRRIGYFLRPVGFFEQRNRFLEPAGVRVVHAQVDHGVERVRVVPPSIAS